MATFDQFIASLEQDFGEQGKGKPFEVFCKWFLENDPEWSKTVDKVWLWDDYPNKWQRQDLGTDLVFRDNDGLIWAVQAKCYGEHRTTTKGDMNSFLADTGRKEVDRRLWLQSTNKIEAKADKTLKGQDKPVTVFMLNDFRDAQIEYPDSFADLYQAKVKAKPTPDTHQIKAIEDATSGLKTSNRGQMIMACGTGKTFTTLWIKEALEAQTTLVLLPSLSLLSQTMREWAWAGNTDFDILNVCSDKSVGKKTEDMDPADAPFPVTSEVAEIAKFLKQPKPKVIFCTYQSSDLISQAQLDEAVPDFDLAVADEAHRCAGKADAGFATILDADKIRASKRLFTTATPRYFGKAIKDAAKARDLAVVGMDNEAVFGPVIHKLTFGQAIYYEPEPLLNDYQVVIVGVDEPMVREWIENYEIVSTDPDSQTDARTLAAKIGMLKAVKDYDLKRVISFHSRVAGAKQFSDELVDVANLIEPANRPEGTFLSDYVSGAMKAGDRKEKIDRLKVLEGYDRGILTNARCLAEGVDVPSLDAVAFIDPKGSQVEIIQAVGRAIRKVRGAAVQKKGTIVLPVFIEDGDDHEASIEASNFKPVWDVLKALRAHDEVLADTLDEYRTNMAKNASQTRESISDKIIFDMPVSVDAKFSSALRTVLVEASTASWEFWFGLFKNFINENGKVKIDQRHKTADGGTLGAWVNAQRQRYKANKLSKDRTEKLETLDGWSWDPFEDAWHEAFELFTEYVRLNNTTVIGKDVFIKDYGLGSWVHTQRQNREKLSAEKQAKIEALPGWLWNPRQDAWNQNLQYLKEFVVLHSRLPIRGELSQNSEKIGNWVVKQRNRRTELPTERQSLLEQIPGWVWDKYDARWQENFNALSNFVSEQGWDSFKQTSVSSCGLKIGAWATQQRSKFKKETLAKDKTEALETIDGWVWDKNEADWEKGFSYLQSFEKLNGHAKVESNTTISGFKLGNWVTQQRQSYSNLDAKKRLRLEKLSGWTWDVLAQQWDQHYEELIEFYRVSCTYAVPVSYLTKSGFRLGSWVKRQLKTDKTLTSKQLEKLNKLKTFWSDNVQEDEWEQKFQALLRYIEEYGSARPGNEFIDRDGVTLGSWVAGQRTSYKKSKLDKYKVIRLQELKGWAWDALEAQWQETYEDLAQIAELNSNCSFAQNYVSKKGNKLGSWLNSQRQRFKQGKLSRDRIAKLEILPSFHWDPLEAAWEESFVKFKQFNDNEGHCLVPAKYVLGDFKLGNWVGTQRINQDLMSPERKQRLDDIGFIWDATKDIT